LGKRKPASSTRADRHGAAGLTTEEAEKLRQHARRNGVTDYHIESIIKHEKDPKGEIGRLIELMQTPRGEKKYVSEPGELTVDEEQIFSRMIAGKHEPKTIV
jgi:hypothetical protein